MPELLTGVQTTGTPPPTLPYGVGVSVGPVANAQQITFAGTGNAFYAWLWKQDPHTQNKYVAESAPRLYPAGSSDGFTGVAGAAFFSAAANEPATIYAQLAYATDPVSMGPQITAAAVVQLSAASGTIVAYAGATVPAGWFICNGQAVSRTTYASLFAAIGTVYGVGDGSTTFNVPDLLGRVPVGLGSNADVAALADSDGLTEAFRSPMHNSTVNDPEHEHQPLTAGNKFMTQGSGAVADAGANINPSAHDATTAPALTGISVGPGGSRPNDTPAYLVVNYIIAQ